MVMNSPVSGLPAAAAEPNIFDAGRLAALKRQVRSNDPAAIKAAAQQFEALFLQIVLKSMRDAVPREGLFDSEQGRMYESLLDQQLAQVVGTKAGGTGLAALIEKQLLRQAEGADDLGPLPLQGPARFLPLNERGGVPLPAPAEQGFLPLPRMPSAESGGAEAPPAAKAFVSRVWPAAVEASRQTGIPPHFLVAHAALETGWGRSEPMKADGSPSFNPFGIKAGRNWQGAVAEASTIEYVDGVPRRQVERFRAYGSYAEAFRDYASLLTGNSRYAQVLGARDPATFAQGLQRAGYATDPAYAEKLQQIIGGATLRQSLIG